MIDSDNEKTFPQDFIPNSNKAILYSRFQISFSIICLAHLHLLNNKQTNIRWLK